MHILSRLVNNNSLLLVKHCVFCMLRGHDACVRLNAFFCLSHLCKYYMLFGPQMGDSFFFLCFLVLICVQIDMSLQLSKKPPSLHM